MNLLLSTMSRHFSGLNHRQFTMADVTAIAERERICLTFAEYPKNIKGYYLVANKKQTHIVINSSAAPCIRLFTALHELAHHFLHVSCYASPIECDRRNDLQANNFALIAMIPFWKLCEIQAVGLGETECAELQQLFERRLNVWEQYGI